MAHPALSAPAASTAPASTHSPIIEALPREGYLRLAQLIPGVIPVSRSTWWRWVESGYAPKAHKLGPRTTAWLARDIRAWLEARSAS
ncbi:helix-turn-helix transcriptional regulator [Roseateles sp.]|uniref:helix-turn-helix transcriptional regulator n=1 Tax=Roseateles sp. TaxID=1971397 RepID=UPI003954F364